jgi:hypothetical protein
VPGNDRQTSKPEALLPRLHHLGDEVPLEARRFHERLGRLLARVETCVGATRGQAPFAAF